MPPYAASHVYCFIDIRCLRLPDYQPSDCGLPLFAIATSVIRFRCLMRLLHFLRHFIFFRLPYAMPFPF